LAWRCCFCGFSGAGDQSLEISTNVFYDQLRKTDKVTAGKPGAGAGAETEYHSVAELKAALAAKKITADQLPPKRQELTNIKSVTIQGWRLSGEVPRADPGQRPRRRTRREAPRSST